MSEVYRTFGKDWAHTHDFTDVSLVELYNSESFGTQVSPLNGFALGKKWLNVCVAMWKEDLEKGYLFKEELYQEGFPHWWLDSVLKDLHPLSWSKENYPKLFTNPN